MSQAAVSARSHLPGAWLTVLRTCNAPAGRIDPVSRWLVLTRACVQPMTLTAAAIAGLLAVRVPGFDPWLFALASARGWPIVGFALGGFVISAGYAAPPLRLKKHGLGEPGVFLVWGPLMVGGTYYAAVGRLPWHIVADTIPYALLCTAV